MNFQRIHALPLHIANQIAAGEVVERPASVLKELVENSLDAGATQIDIEVAGAGSELVQVTDNGSGIHKDDLALALSRHATSKLLTTDDLSHIGSLGFRGEALPSIASVSRLTLTSRSLDDEYAWQLSSNDTTLQPAAHPQGTTVSVAELFFNIPARRRFLRSEKTELHHLLTTLHRLALSRFDVGFNYHWGEQQSLRLPAITQAELRQQRIAKICGRSFVNDSLYLEQKYEDVYLHGWIGKPSAHRAQTDVQYFFINGRVIKDRVINHAIRLAYDELLPAGRQPAYVLYLTLPLDKVDVNVHPTKHEVRFREARLIHGLITQALRDALYSTSTTSFAELQLPFETPSASNEGIKEAKALYEKKPLSHQQRIASEPTIQNLTADAPNTAKMTLLHQRYALINNDTPYLLDLVEADKYLRRNQIISAIAKGNLASRPILVPMQFELNEADIGLFNQHQTLLQHFAIETISSGRYLVVKRIPYLLSQVDIKCLLESLSQQFRQNDSAEIAIKQALISEIPEVTSYGQLQAQQIIEQLTLEELEQHDWCSKLDPATLSGLFSG